MKRFFSPLVVLVVFSIFTISANAGDIPIMGVEGCAPGTLWMPSNICCQPNQECPVGRFAPAITKIEVKTESEAAFESLFLPWVKEFHLF